MAYSSIEESLIARRDELDEALVPFRPLIEEREHIEGLLTFYRARAEAGPLGLTGSAPGSRSPSKVGKLLTRSREVLKGRVDHEMTFLELLQSMPTDVLGEGRNVREHFRGMLQRAGDKYGLEYVNAECVRLIETRGPTPAPLPQSSLPTPPTPRLPPPPQLQSIPPRPPLPPRKESGPFG